MKGTKFKKKKRNKCTKVLSWDIRKKEDYLDIIN